ncbi:MAG: agmatine deiminase family protein [Candidatus Bathyarchaeota archaeon]|nr:agmatine deiminase family protein [Candidatus Bathyarchaeota archaeon]
MNSVDVLGKTPRELGYRMPAEWEKHDSIWLSWPYDPATFPFRVEKAEATYVEIIKSIHESERVNLLVRDKAMEQRVQRMLLGAGVDLGQVRFLRFDYADVWFRDYGPTFVVHAQGGLGMVRWVFNAWGEKYDDLLKDRYVGDYLQQLMVGVPCFKPQIVLEGGSVDVNGKGLVLTTEQCLLNSNRNPELDKAQIEVILKDYLNAKKVIWLKKGIAGDDTDGHVDDIARFVSPSTVLCTYEPDPTDENHEILKENYELLCDFCDQDGNKLNVIKLPMPTVLGDENERLPASYANFYIGNKTVLVPVFDHENDALALSIIQEQFPDRKAVGINCVDLIYGLGSIHCISQQQPAAKV